MGLLLLQVTSHLVSVSKGPCESVATLAEIG
jgi:hypothetical protein